jgi:xyloglucan-specific exo-beta-1,4-glucanase
LFVQYIELLYRLQSWAWYLRPLDSLLYLRTSYKFVHVFFISSLLSAGDVGGWAHGNLNSPPSKVHLPYTLRDIDYAGNVPSKMVVTGDQAGSLAVSTDGGLNWASYPGTTPTAGKITYSANATSIIYSGSNAVSVAQNGGAFVTSSGVPVGALVEADKTNDVYVSSTC